MTQANALSVEWNFGDGVTKTEGADEYQRTEVTHGFVRGGELTVTETIHTDDLATPTIVRQAKIVVANTAVAPTAGLEGPLELTLGAARPTRLVYLEGGGLGLEPAQAGPGEEAGLYVGATFDGSSSSDSNPPGSNRIVAYHWVFGDGSSETTESAVVTHPYMNAGVYKVELTVTDGLGLSSEPSTLTVRVNALAPKAEAVRQIAQATVAPQIQRPTPATPVHVPAAGLASVSLAASSNGILRLVITCPAAVTSCAGTVTLSALGVTGARAPGGKSRVGKNRVQGLTLAGGTFVVAGGRQKTLTLRLSAKGRSLLIRTHHLRALATIVARDPAGTTDTTKLTVSLRVIQRHVKK
jgi:PKD repeat protein